MFDTVEVMRVVDTNQLSDPEFLTRAEVAAMARTTLERVRYWDRKGLLPRVRPHGTSLVLYPRQPILAWLRGDWPPRAMTGGRP